MSGRARVSTFNCLATCRPHACVHATSAASRDKHVCVACCQPLLLRWHCSCMQLDKHQPAAALLHCLPHTQPPSWVCCICSCRQHLQHLCLGIGLWPAAGRARGMQGTCCWSHPESAAAAGCCRGTHPTLAAPAAGNLHTHRHRNRNQQVPGERVNTVTSIVRTAAALGLSKSCHKRHVASPAILQSNCL
jgi:hypothetical protein